MQGIRPDGRREVSALPPIHATPGDTGSWHERVEAHLTPDEIAAYRLACSMLEDLKTGRVKDAASAEISAWLPFALDTKDDMTARAIMRMHVVGGGI